MADAYTKPSVCAPLQAVLKTGILALNVTQWLMRPPPPVPAHPNLTNPSHLLQGSLLLTCRHLPSPFLHPALIQSTVNFLPAPFFHHAAVPFDQKRTMHEHNGHTHHCVLSSLHILLQAVTFQSICLITKLLHSQRRAERHEHGQPLRHYRRRHHRRGRRGQQRPFSPLGRPQDHRDLIYGG